jgi:antitoxin component HigA of HigAB toxin-antitoxin module
MPYYKDINNQLHVLDSAEFEYLLPADCVEITDVEAQIIQDEYKANQPTPVELTPQEKLAKAGLTVDELKSLLGINGN